MIWSLQANCLGLQVLGTRGKGRKQGCEQAWRPVWKPSRVPPPSSGSSSLHPAQAPTQGSGVEQGRGQGLGVTQEHCVPETGQGKDAGSTLLPPDSVLQAARTLSPLPGLKPVCSLILWSDGSRPRSAG